MTQGLGGFLLKGGGCCYGCGASCRADAGPGFRFFLFCLQIIMEIKIFNSIQKQKYPKLL